MKLAIIFISLLLLALCFCVESKKNHHRTVKNHKKWDGNIHPKYRRMLWDPNWGDKDKLIDDGTANPGVIHSQLEKIEEYRRKELKKGLYLLRKQRNERSGGCRSRRA